MAERYACCARSRSRSPYAAGSSSGEAIRRLLSSVRSSSPASFKHSAISALFRIAPPQRLMRSCAAALIALRLLSPYRICVEKSFAHVSASRAAASKHSGSAPVQRRLIYSAARRLPTCPAFSAVPPGLHTPCVPAASPAANRPLIFVCHQQSTASPPLLCCAQSAISSGCVSRSTPCSR